MDINYELERKVLSVMMHDEASCIDALARLTPSDFYQEYNKTLFEVMGRVYSKGGRVSFVIVLNECHKHGIFGDDFDHEYLKWIADHYVPGASGPYFVGEQLKISKTKKLDSILSQYQAMISDDVLDVERDLGVLVGDITDIYTSGEGDIDTSKVLAAQLREIMSAREAKYNAAILVGEMAMEGVATGLHKLDEITLGYSPGNLVLLAAETGHGKSAFALHTAKVVAIDQGKNVLYINTEMSRSAVVCRLASNISGIEYSRLRQGNIGEDAYKWEKALGIVERSGFYHYYAPNLTPIRCAMVARQAVMRYKVDMIIVDYIGRMEKFVQGQTEWQMLEQIVKSQKLIAQELGVPVMILAQLNSDGTLQGAKRIKNECDIMLKLLPLDNEGKERCAGKFVDANYRLQVDKNRDGMSGISIILHFDKDLQRIEQARELVLDHWLEVGEYVNGPPS